MSPVLSGYFWSVLASLASAMATLLIKLSHQENAGWTLSRLTYLGGACGTYGLGFICYSIALQRLQISLAYPLMTAFTMLLVMLIGFIILGENLSPTRLAGAGLIIAGAFVLSRS
ncbi:multidrug efflux SMR transporter [Massilia sp. erpn]|uniref:DMT family transporter n=1 Tax=Massilia sp. erpn TaxID=2738142 RepID=UPI00210313E3|nr:SMR family transporter [Massilia sp. erpn]